MAEQTNASCLAKVKQKMQAGRAKASKKCEVVKQKNARWPSKKCAMVETQMQVGRAEDKKKCQTAEQQNVRWPSKSFFFNARWSSKKM
jgi:hypothetical protein